MDWLPQDWTQDERFYQYDRWFENEAMQEANMKYYYDQVTGKFDKILAEHGYVRDGHYYRVEKLIMIRLSSFVILVWDVYL